MLCLAVAMIIIAIVLGRSSQSQPAQAVTNRVPTLPSPPPAPVEEPKKNDPAPDPPFYGSTMYEGEVTSVYYYPKGPNSAPGEAVTHVKFNHHEEDPEQIWLCGDHRNQFDVGSKYHLRVS